MIYLSFLVSEDYTLSVAGGRSSPCVWISYFVFRTIIVLTLPQFGHEKGWCTKLYTAEVIKTVVLEPDAGRVSYVVFRSHKAPEYVSRNIISPFKMKLHSRTISLNYVHVGIKELELFPRKKKRMLEIFRKLIKLNIAIRT